jgi:hypothetical protein
MHVHSCLFFFRSVFTVTKITCPKVYVFCFYMKKNVYPFVSRSMLRHVSRDWPSVCLSVIIFLYISIYILRYIGTRNAWTKKWMIFSMEKYVCQKSLSTFAHRSPILDSSREASITVIYRYPSIRMEATHTCSTVATVSRVCFACDHPWLILILAGGFSWTPTGFDHPAFAPGPSGYRVRPEQVRLKTVLDLLRADGATPYANAASPRVTDHPVNGETNLRDAGRLMLSRRISWDFH